MKILHLIYDHINNPWVGGGGAVRVYEIYKRLAERHHITVVCGKYPGAKDYEEGNLRFHFVGTCRNNYVLSTFCYAVKAAQFLFLNSRPRIKFGANSELYDIVIEDFAPWNPLFSKFLTKRQVILHINHKEGINILKRWLIFGMPFFIIEAFYPHFFSYVTALSEETKKKLNIPHAVIVPAGINRVHVEALLSASSDEEGDYILYIGRLHIKNKGLDTLLTAMKGTNIKLLLVGCGKDEAKLKEMAERLKLKGVVFMGFLSEDEKVKILKGTQLLVLSSRYEGQGIVVLEAAACGKPVIVSDIPELRYAVDAGFGISFKTEDARDLAEKIKFLLENDTLRREMGRRAREYAKNFTWDEVALEYERFLMKVVEDAKKTC